MKILVVEDEPVSSAVLESLLATMGSVTPCATGTEAVQNALKAIEQNEPFELVCIDIGLPDMDGFAVLQAIRDAESTAGLDCVDGARVLMVTASEEEGHVLQAFREQADGYLTKPYGQEDLERQLSKLGYLEAFS